MGVEFCIFFYLTVGCGFKCYINMEINTDNFVNDRISTLLYIKDILHIENSIYSIILVKKVTKKEIHNQYSQQNIRLPIICDFNSINHTSAVYM